MDHIPAKVVCVAESMEKLIPAIKKHVADFLAPIGVDKFYTDYTLSEVEKYFSGDKTEPSYFVGVTKKKHRHCSRWNFRHVTFTCQLNGLSILRLPFKKQISYKDMKAACSEGARRFHGSKEISTKKNTYDNQPGCQVQHHNLPLEEGLQ